MPSQRYLLVEGVAGHLVSDPHSPGASPARYVGWALSAAPASDPDHAGEHYEPIKQVVLEHGDIKRAVASRRLTLVNTVVAKSHDAARAALVPPPAVPKSINKKSGEL